jgi:hypothetical protein
LKQGKIGIVGKGKLDEYHENSVKLLSAESLLSETDGGLSLFYEAKKLMK